MHAGIHIRCFLSFSCSSFFFGGFFVVACQRTPNSNPHTFSAAAGIMKERIALEEQYVKGMQKLSAKAMKCTDATAGSMTSAWLKLLGEIDGQAAYHGALAQGVRACIMDPLTKLKVRRCLKRCCARGWKERKNPCFLLLQKNPNKNKKNTPTT
jgi:hypothetical protein